jgi:hypothetical protein
MEDVVIYYGHLVHFAVFCYILWTFGIVCGNFVYIPVLVCCYKKNLATLFTSSKFKTRWLFSIVACIHVVTQLNVYLGMYVENRNSLHTSPRISALSLILPNLKLELANEKSFFCNSLYPFSKTL